ncbi:MAG: RNA polymerase sigma factor [Bacteroidota bacterium]
MKEAEYLKLMEANQERLQRICRFYCRDVEAQKDLMQEIAFQIWRSRERYRGEAQLNTWLYRIGINTALAYLRKQKKRETQPLEAKAQVVADARNPEEKLEQQERLDLLMQAIQQLKKLDQSIILLYLEELSYQEIAKVTGLSESNVGVKINRIKKRISQNLKKSTGYELR